MTCDYNGTSSRTTRTTPGPQEEGEYEYITNHGGKGEHHVEPAVLVQPLGETAEGCDEGGESSDVLAPPPCAAYGCTGGHHHKSKHSGSGYGGGGH